MKIDLFRQTALLHGVATLDADADGLILSRLTPELAGFHRSAGENADTRAAAWSGVRLLFTTDSRWLGCRLGFRRAARPIYQTDVRIDDGPFQSFGPPERTEEFAFSIELPGGGLHRVEIQFPHLVECRLRELAVEDGSRVRPVRQPGGELLFIGDSITQGMTASSPSRTYAALTAAALDADFTNLAVGGTIFQPELGKFAAAYRWRRVILAYGTNDQFIGRDPDEMAHSLTTLLKRLTRRTTAETVLITPIVRPNETGPNRLGLMLADYRRRIAETAAAFPQVKIVDGGTLAPDRKDFFVDGIHPNDPGMQCYADGLIRTLRPRPPSR